MHHESLEKKESHAVWPYKVADRCLPPEYVATDIPFFCGAGGQIRRHGGSEAGEDA